MLEQVHYSQKPFDDEVSSKFFDRYFDSLDSFHFYFFQSDVAEFENYRHKLDDLTLKIGDTRPAHLIFARLLKRAEQRSDYVKELLKTEKFTFDTDEHYATDRRKLPHPKDLTEAKQLWRTHLRSEFLQEKLSFALTNVNASVVKSTNSPSSQTNKVWNASREEEIVKKISKRYTNLMKNLKELSDDEVLEIYLNSLTQVYDPHSDYMGRSHFEDFNIQMKLSLFGIGALLRSEDGYCKIEKLMSGPALKSKKIKPEDRIVAVAQGDDEPVDVVDMRLKKVVDLIRGEKGTEVRLTVWPADAADSSVRKEVTLIRDEIKIEEQEAKAKVIEIPGKKSVTRLGVIDLPLFYADMESSKLTRKSTTTDIARLLKKLNQEKVNGIILDLRRNGGGSLDEAISLTGLFITNGPVVQVRDQNGVIVTQSDDDASIAYKGPLIVLTSHFSASASEILAGALQDYGRAIIVGESSTFGKGTVQRLMKLDPYLEQQKMLFSYDPGALKPTTAKFYRAGGSSTQLRGVIPDMKLPSVLDFAEIGEASMQNPLSWDEVSTAAFDKWDVVKPFLPELQKRSEHRTQNSLDFDYIRGDIKEFKKNLADKSISLNETTRRQEKKEIDDRDESRKTERKARKPADTKIFEVTLKNADEPGLQPYVPKTNELAAATATVPADLDEEETNDKTPPVDPVLEETEHILLDYISLTPALSNSLTKVQ
ncbi:MAG: carboxy terminal-processing peptidase [Verrucomicrobiota bacterium]